MTLAIERLGNAQTRAAPLVWIHGWGVNSAIWQNLAAEWATERPVWLVDLPGHGRSAPSPLTTLEAAADTLATELPDGAAVLGWSLGGQLALALAQRHPARVGRLALVATTPHFRTSSDWPYGQTAEVLDLFASQLANAWETTLRRFLALQVLNQPSARQHLAYLHAALLSRGSPDLASLANGLALLRDTDLRQRLASIVQPALVIQGVNDRLTPAPAGRWLAQSLPNATYCEIDDAGHAPFLSHRATFNSRLKSFLDG